MTREQAKREIDSLDYYLQNHTDDYGEESHTAMMMAIKALGQEPCEDAISRQAVLDGIDTYINKAQSTGTQDDFYSFAELVVKELPSVTPQEPFMNKPCVANQVCHEDKVKVIEKIRAEIDEQYDRVHPYNISCAEGLEMALGIIEKYK